jgi:chromatin remodeling complex protein RSC6
MSTISQPVIRKPAVVTKRPAAVKKAETPKVEVLDENIPISKPVRKTVPKSAPAPAPSPVASDDSGPVESVPVVKASKPRASRAKKCVDLPAVAEVAEPAAAADEVPEKKRNKKQKLHDQIIEEAEKLTFSMEKDLESGKYDKATEKLVRKYLKEAAKIETKAKKLQKKPATTEPKTVQSGFSKPQLITDEMADFAGWERGCEKSRNDINRALCAYIKENGLQAESNKRLIQPDENLAELLQYDEADFGPLDFARMQKLLGHLIVKPAVEIN